MTKESNTPSAERAPTLESVIEDIDRMGGALVRRGATRRKVGGGVLRPLLPARTPHQRTRDGEWVLRSPSFKLDPPDVDLLKLTDWVQVVETYAEKPKPNQQRPPGGLVLQSAGALSVYQGRIEIDTASLMSAYCGKDPAAASNPATEIPEKVHALHRVLSAEFDWYLLTTQLDK